MMYELAMSMSECRLLVSNGVRVEYDVIDVP